MRMFARLLPGERRACAQREGIRNLGVQPHFSRLTRAGWTENLGFVVTLLGVTMSQNSSVNQIASLFP